MIRLFLLLLGASCCAAQYSAGSYNDPAGAVAVIDPLDSTNAYATTYFGYKYNVEECNAHVSRDSLPYKLVMLIYLLGVL